jgi:hypothetical protein
MTRHIVSIEIDEAFLSGYSDSFLATLWHVAQANPASIDDPDAGELAERIGREIIRRWLREVPPELWHHQGLHYYGDQLRQLGTWVDGVFVPHDRAVASEASGGAS